MNEKSWDCFAGINKIKPPESAVENPAHLPSPPKGMKVWKNNKNEFTVCSVHYSADESKRSRESYTQLARGLRQDQIDRELEIDFNSQAGERAFPYLLEKPEKYLIDDIPLDKIPKHWRIIAGFDFGTNNPTSINFYGIDEKRRITSFWEFYKPSNIPEIALALSGDHPKYRHKLWSRVERVVADPSIFNRNQQDIENNDIVSLAILLEREMIRGGLTINLVPGINDRLSGLERLRMLFNAKPLDPDAESYLKFCRRCENQWREFTSAVYREMSPAELMTKNQHEDIVKKNDHSYDNCRYVSMSVDFPSELPGPGPAAFFTLETVEKELDRKTDKHDFF